MTFTDDTPFRTIPLGSKKYPGHVAIVDAADYDLVARWRWTVARRKRTNGQFTYYAARNDRGTAILMHRQITEAQVGLDVDHEDGDGLNCRRYNMRVCTRRNNSRNQRNLRRGKSSRFPGVRWVAHRGKWQVRIHAGVIDERGHSKVIHLGYFLREEDAARAYREASLRYFGEFSPFARVESRHG